MIISNLNVLLAERKLTISKVSKDTGISRTTLTSLCSNFAKGIQFDTLNSLIKYFKIKFDDVFLYGDYINLKIDFFSSKMHFNKTICFQVNIDENNKISNIFLEKSQDAILFHELLDNIPVMVQTYIDDKIIECITYKLDKDTSNNLLLFYAI